jgi:acyl-CoA thioester hydrolase
METPEATKREITERIVLTEDDIDQLGHVNQARYHDLLGHARNLLLTQGVEQPSGPDGKYVVARTELDYHRELRLVDGYADVHAQIARVGTKSVTIANELIRPDGVVAASGVTTMVAWDPEARRSRTISPAERAHYGG